jgi:chromosomal replication initiation ATPase DnaA
MNERLGIYEELQAMQAMLGPFKYVAPTIVDDEIPEDAITGDVIAILEDVGRRLAILEGKAKKRISRLDLPSDPLVSHSAVADVLEAVADSYGISVRAILSPARPQKLCRPRFAAAWLLKKKLHMSSPRAARCLKRMDHTSVVHMWQRAEYLLAHDPEWAALYRAAEHALDAK